MNIGPVELLLFFVVQVVFVVASALVANRKGYSAAVWAVVALFLGFLIAVLMALRRR